MKVDGKQMRPIWLDEKSRTVKVIDQRQLPHRLIIVELTTVDKVIEAIQAMFVRGAPLIGATGAYGVYVAALNTLGDSGDEALFLAECARIKSARPTAVNLAWGIEKVMAEVLKEEGAADKITAAKTAAANITEQEADNCRQIGEAGLELVKTISERKEGKTVHVLTHCNAGWLACVEYGTATAPIYAAFDKGIDVHVWVDETRPLNQGARLTAWELGKHGIKHTIVTDNAGGHLMQHGMVDIVIVGTDRTTRNGDVANKIGTYLKALAARDNDIPFYVALPSSTFDWQASDGLKEIPIEERDPDEVRYVQGDHAGSLQKVLISPADSPAFNPAFDVTPAGLVTGLITERGVCEADETDILRLFPEHQ
jgi:methylthioribose-1-phosphate isomerase